MASISITTHSGAMQEKDDEVAVVLGSPSPTSSSSRNFPSPLYLPLQLADPDNATACSGLSLFWNYFPEYTGLVTLFVAGWQPLGSATAAIPVNYMSPTFRTLAVNIPSHFHNFTWDAVDVHEGWYYINITETVPQTGISARSAPFFVESDPNATCLEHDSFNTWASHKPNTTVHHTPPRPLRPAELVGIVLGAVAGVCILAIAFIFPRLWRRSLPSPKKRRPYILY